MSYNYTSFVAALSLELQIPVSNAAFQAILPTIIDQAEQTIYRDLQLLSTIIRDATGVTTPDQRRFTLPTANGIFVVLKSVNIINGTSRTPCVKISREVMDALYPDDTGTPGVTPRYYAPESGDSSSFSPTILLGPAPVTTLNVECIGNVRPTPLSAVNDTTFLSSQLPDLMLAAAVVSGTGYQRNWGAQADDPKIALSWQDTYKQRLANASGEETMRKYQAFSTLR